MTTDRATAVENSMKKLKELQTERQEIIKNLQNNDEMKVGKIKELTNRVHSLEMSNKQLIKEKKELEKKLEDSEKKTEDLERDKHDLMGKLSDLTEENKTLTTKVEEFIKKAEPKLEQVPVQIFFIQSPQLMDDVVDKLVSSLNKELKLQNKEILEQKCSGPDEIQEQKVLLVLHLCQKLTESEVAREIQDIKASQKVAQVIFYMKEEHALPASESSAVLTGREFKELGGIFDMAYLKGRGIFQCKMNKTSVPKLANFIVRSST